jgi:hypothetical protein
VSDRSQTRAILVDVRRVLARHGVSLGDLHLPVVLEPSLQLTGAEGITVKASGSARRLASRRVEAIALCPGLPALHAAKVLA